jgi:capsular polysaccharide transport system ATP-binding protein
MGLKFDTYLIDEVTAVGDAQFAEKSREVFLDRLNDSGAVFVSHSMGILRRMCTAGAVLEKGRLLYFDDLEEAIEVHEQNTRK